MSVALDPWALGYLDYLADVRRKAHRTVVDVRCTLRRVATDMAEVRPGVALWDLELGDYVRWLNDQRREGRTSASVAKDLSHIRGLLEYAWRSGKAHRNVLDGFTLCDAKPKSAPRALTLDEAQRLVAALPSGSASERRDRVIVLMLYGCGLRTSELCRLRVQDVDREHRQIRILRAKGDRQRTVPVPEGVYTELLAYLVERGGRQGPLFRTDARRVAVSNHHVCRVVREAAERAEVPGKITPKTLRHTFATHLMDRGVDLAVIASLMGHRTPTDTGIYLHVLPGRPEQAVHSLDTTAEDPGGTTE